METSAAAAMSSTVMCANPRLGDKLERELFVTPDALPASSIAADRCRVPHARSSTLREVGGRSSPKAEGSSSCAQCNNAFTARLRGRSNKRFEPAPHWDGVAK